MPSNRKSTRAETTAAAEPRPKRMSFTHHDLAGWSPAASHVRDRAGSFNSDMSDELDAIDRELQAEEALAANALTQRRSDPIDIKDVEVDHMCDQIYERMEEEAMLELLSELQNEMVPFSSSGSAPKVGAPKVGAPTAVAPPTCAGAKGKPAAKQQPATNQKAAEQQPASAPREDLLWNLVATPDMMRAFAHQVVNAGGGGIAVS